MENKIYQSSLNNNYKHINFLFFIYLGLTLIFIAGFRPIGIDGDSLNYSSVLNRNWSDIDLVDKEPTFWLIDLFNTLLFDGNPQTFFLMFALIGVSVKLIVIRKYSLTPLLSLLTYVSMFYILQEMTQIRAGVAIGLLYWSIDDSIHKRKINFLIKIIIAILFHYSAVVMLLIYLVSSSNLNKKFYTLLPIFGIILSITKFLQFIIIYIVQFLPNFLSTKINLYFLLMEQDKIVDVSPFNIGNFFLLIIYYLLLYSTNNKISINKYYLVCLKLLGFGFFILFSLSFVEVFAYRMANYLFFSLVFLLPLLAKCFKDQLPILLFILMYLIYTLIKNHSALLNL